MAIEYSENMPRQRNLLAQPDIYRMNPLGSIFAGAFVATVVILMLNTLGLAMSLNTLTNINAPLGASTVGLAVWLIVTNIVGYFCGAYVAGRLSGYASYMAGAMHGLSVWGVTTIFSFLLMFFTPTGLLLGGLNGVIASAIILLSTAGGSPAALATLTSGLAIAALIGIALNMLAAAYGGSAGVKKGDIEPGVESDVEEEKPQYKRVA